VPADGRWGLNIVKEVFGPGLEALLNRQATARECEQRIEEVRTALSDILQSSPVEAETVMVIGARAVIAAGFEAALLEIKEKRLAAPEDGLHSNRGGRRLAPYRPSRTRSLALANHPLRPWSLSRKPGIRRPRVPDRHR
jgi:hypothetical protein